MFGQRFTTLYLGVVLLRSSGSDTTFLFNVLLMFESVI